MQKIKKFKNDIGKLYWKKKIENLTQGNSTRKKNIKIDIGKLYLKKKIQKKIIIEKNNKRKKYNSKIILIITSLIKQNELLT